MHVTVESSGEIETPVELEEEQAEAAPEAGEAQAATEEAPAAEEPAS